MIRPWLIRRNVDQALQIVGLEVVIPLAASGIENMDIAATPAQPGFVGLFSFI